MKVLGLDPGAKRCGWAVIEGDGQTAPIYHGSGVVYCIRGDHEDFQPYRLRLEEHWWYVAPRLLREYDPVELVNETLPPVGYNNSTQAYLANVQLTVAHAAALERDVPITQIAASTVKAAIAKKGKTKVSVRNGVCDILPELAPRKFQWTKIFEEPDAIAVALARLGYKLREVK